MISSVSSRVRDAVHTLGETLSWRPVLRDLVVVVLWVLLVTFVFRAMGWPHWLYFVVAFGGVIGYSLVGGPRLDSGVA